MHHNYYLSPLVAAVAMTLVNPVQAAKPLVLQDMDFQAVQQKFSIKLPNITLTPSKGSVNALEFIKQRVDKNQIAHIRMQQTYAGFPVYKGYAILHTPDPEALTPASSVFMNGTLYEGLQEELGLPAKDFVKGSKLAIQNFKKMHAEASLRQVDIAPMVYIDEEDHAHWAYKINARVDHIDAAPEILVAIIDAKTFVPYLTWDDIKNEVESVKGYGFGGNAKMGQLQYGKGALPLLDMTFDAKKSTCYLQNTEVKIVDMKSSTDRKKTAATAFKCNMIQVDGRDAYTTGYAGDGYDMINGAFNPANDAHYSGYVIKHMYHDWYGLHVLTQPDGKTPLQLVMRVHFGNSYENAYWDPQQMYMTFGDGATTFYPLVSLGIAAHEVSHGFTQQHADLQYWGQSGGLNESFSDMAAMAAEFYSVGASTWLIGAEIVKPFSGLKTLRYMDVPSKDGRSIDSADQYRDDMDVHYTSGVYNRMFYLLANTTGWDTRSAFDVMVKANADYWTPTATFKDAGCGVLHAAQDLNFSLEDVKAALDKVAIDHSGCTMRADV